jgi:aryl-phospho-beta-D-glucosidase BglC (GH1 family)
MISIMTRLIKLFGRALVVFGGLGVSVGFAPEGAAAATPGADSAKMPLPLKVVGPKILNSKDEPVLLRGVNVPSMEWTKHGEGRVLQTVNAAIRDWHVNIIRLPLAQDRWFGKAPEQKDDGTSYRTLVREVVDTCATQGCYIVVDLHWSDCNEWGSNIAQHCMPDSNSVTFWKDCAALFKNHPAVIFDLYNEPHDVSWNVWLNGGTITDRSFSRRGSVQKTYEAVGMQTLLDTVRATGAKNVVIAGTLDWSYDFSGILDGIQLFDRDGNGVIYANHTYNIKNETADQWIARMEKAAAKLPVIVSEFGGSGGSHKRAPRFGRGATNTNDDWLLHVMQALEDHHWAWVAWCMHVSAGPPMLSDWNYTPTPDFGMLVKQALAGELPRYTPPARIETIPTGSGTNAAATNAPPVQPR